MKNDPRKRELSCDKPVQGQLRASGAKNSKIPRVVVAGLRGGSGKTTLSIGLVSALRQRGMKVAPFKKGPDYIDAGWLSSAAASPCYNLDPHLIGERRALYSFISHSHGSDIAVIEGNRGLFDGMDAEGTCSTSGIARLIKSPVVLILDCTKATRSMAALVLGSKLLEKGLRLEGVVLNQIAGARHERITRQSIEAHTGVPVLGAIPRMAAIGLPERHMGLTPRDEYPEVGEAIATLGRLIEQHADVKRILDIASNAQRIAYKPQDEPPPYSAPKIRPRIGVVRDSAFQFYYPENIEELSRAGAEMVEVSAIGMKRLPEGLDALYIGGGFPETHSVGLSRNKTFRASLRDAVEAGLPVYAECGGLMYLGSALIIEGRRHEMSGVLPLEFSMHQRPRAHGYTAVTVSGANPFMKKGTVLNGHEFHYSAAEPTTLPDKARYAYTNTRGRGIADGHDGITYKNVVASYTHIHALGAPQWVEGMIKAAVKFSRR